ncbi:hypothetical protein FA95DRAFT_1187811, partial [Auriscalpium vulgare]
MQPGKTDPVVWNETLFFDLNGASVVKLEIWADRHLKSKRCIAKIAIPVSGLLQSLHDLHTLEIIYPKESTQHVIAQVAVGVANSAPRFMALLDGAIDLEELVTFADVWGPLLNKINSLTAIIDKVSEVHPYLHMAWSLLDAGHKIVLAQQDRDARIQQLAEVIASAYNSFTIEDESFQPSQNQQHILNSLSKQTVECGYFIISYYKNSFWKRTTKHIFSDVDSLISKYEAEFHRLKAALQTNTATTTQLVVQKTFGDLEDLMEKFDLSDIPYAKGARYQTGKQCLIGTRKEILQKIINWINISDEKSSRVLLLTGLSGTGKSSVAHTIAEYYNQLGRLGSSFCFDKKDLQNRNARTLFGTLAKDLSEFDQSFRHALVKSIGNSSSLRGTQDLSDQFKHFLLNPTQNLSISGPIIIVIDGLDESENLGARTELLQLLGNKLKDLPPNFRILLTSRPEDDVRRILMKNENIYCEAMETISKASNDHDILHYVHSQLTDEMGQPLACFGEKHYKTLAEKSEGLFQWVFVACYIIKGNGQGIPPHYIMVEEYEHITSGSGQAQLTGVLDDLYKDILSHIFPGTRSPKLLQMFKKVMGQVLTAFEPLSVTSLREIHSLTTDSLNWVLSQLGALLTGVSDLSQPIHFLHSSFYDFLSDESKSGEFHVGYAGQFHKEFVQSAVNTLNQELRFNMCNFPSSYLANSDVPGL